MAAVVSSNPARDYRFIQAGFPAVFSKLYEESGAPFQWFREANAPRRAVEWVGEPSVQDAWHRQKLDDARRSCLEGVADTKRSIWRAMRHHQGQDLPKPVLGQRKYANPSFGADSIYSGRPDQFRAHDEGLTGGIVQTAQGQRWAHQQLQGRIGQLNAMKDATFTSYTAPKGQDKISSAVNTGQEEASGVKLHLELAAALQSLVEKVSLGMTAPNKVLLHELYAFFKLLFRVGATATLGELNDVLASLQSAIEPMEASMVNSRLDEFARLRPTQDLSKFRKSVYELLTRAVIYVEKMIVNVDKSARERRLISANTVKHLKFTSLGVQTLEFSGLTVAAKANELQQKARDLHTAYARASDEVDEIRGRLEAARDALEDDIGRIPEEDVEEAREFIVATEDELEEALKIRRAARKALNDINARIVRLPAGAADEFGIDMGEEHGEDSDEESEHGEGRGRGRFRGRGEAPRRVLFAPRIENRPHLPHEVKLTRDPRAVWAARQGAWFGEALPMPEGYVAPPMKKLGPASLPLHEARSAVPTFDKGQPVEDAPKQGGRRYFRSKLE